MKKRLVFATLILIIFSILYIIKGNTVYATPADPSISVDKTAPTNTDVNAGIVYSSDSVVKQYKLGAAGEWQSVTGVAQENLLTSKTFNGTTDYTDLGTKDYDFRNGFSVEFDARWDALNDGSRIIDFGNGQASDNVIIYNNMTTNTFTVGIFTGATSHFLNISNAITVGQMAHWKVDIDMNGYCKVYKNTINIGEQQLVVPKNLPRTKCYIGKDNWGAVNLFQGEIDNLSITTYPIQTILMDDNLLTSKTFNGTTDYTDLGTKNYDFRNGFSVEFDARWDALNDGSRIIDFGNGQASDNVIIYNNMTTNTFTVGIFIGATSNFFSISNAITVGQMAHWKVDIDVNGYCKVYKNTVNIGEQQLVVPKNLPRTKCYIGKDNWGAVNLFRGEIDNLSITTNPIAIAITENNTIYAKAQDSTGNWSNITSYVVSNIDKIAPTVNVPTETHTTTSITANADATDPSTPMQYLFNLDGVDQGVWQAGSSYAFTGLTIDTTYAVKYKAKDSVGNISGYSDILNVTTTAGEPAVPTVSKLEVLDTANDDNASDIRVMFKGATSEANIASYKVIVSTGTINEATASALTSTSFVSDRTKGAGKIHLFTLTVGLKTSENTAINAAGGTYNVYVLSVAKAGYNDTLSAPVSITIITNNEGYRVTASKPTVMDTGNNGNGTDIKVTFRKSKSEVNVQEYRVIVSTTTLTLAQAQSVLAAGYKLITPTNPKLSYTTTLGAAQKISDGVSAIQNGTAYKIYILAIGKNGYANVLSAPSNAITLSQYVPGPLVVRSLKATKVGTGHDSSNIKVTFYEPIAVSNIQEYRVFIAPSANILNQTTAEGIADTNLYQVVATTGKGTLHSVTLDSGKKDYTSAALTAGNYKVYVLTVGKTGYANKLSLASGNVTLN